MSEWKDITAEIDAMPEPDKQYIDLDCPPGPPRPGDLIGGVIKDTGLPERPAALKWMGNWRWTYDDVDPETWAAAKLIIGPRIVELHRRGAIRYGSW